MLAAAARVACGPAQERAGLYGDCRRTATRFAAFLPGTREEVAGASLRTVRDARRAPESGGGTTPRRPASLALQRRHRHGVIFERHHARSALPSVRIYLSALRKPKRSTFMKIFVDREPVRKSNGVCVDLCAEVSAWTIRKALLIVLNRRTGRADSPRSRAGGIRMAASGARPRWVTFDTARCRTARCRTDSSTSIVTDEDLCRGRDSSFAVRTEEHRVAFRNRCAWHGKLAARREEACLDYVGPPRYGDHADQRQAFAGPGMDLAHMSGVPRVVGGRRSTTGTLCCSWKV